MIAWMQHSWAEDYQEQWKLLENNSYLTASFSNPAGVQKALGIGATKSASTDEEMEATLRWIREDVKQEREQTLQPRKRRRKIQQ